MAKNSNSSVGVLPSKFYPTKKEVENVFKCLYGQTFKPVSLPSLSLSSTNDDLASIKLG